MWFSSLNAKQKGALALSVSVPPLQLRTAALIVLTQSVLARTGFPQAVGIQSDRGRPIDDTEASCQVMEWLKALGVRLAVDGFSTGYTGLPYLLRFPINVVGTGPS